MRHIVFGLILIVFASGCKEEVRPAVDSLTLSGRIDSYLTDLEATGFTGVALVETPNGVIVERGYGMSDDSLGTVWSPETVFTVGSITKQFTAAAILKLQMEGRLNVADRLGDYITGLPEDKADITLHHLLTHSAGFPGAIGDDQEPLSREAFIERALATELMVEPGTAYNYSNVGYSLLAAVIEIVSGDSYESYMQKALFQPAGMAHTGYVLPDWSGTTEASGYRRDEKWGTLSSRMYGTDGPYWNLVGNGGILSTARDLLVWHHALMGETVLDSTSTALMIERHVTEGPHASSYYGYGWALTDSPTGTRLVSHNGGNGVFFADFLRYIDDGVTVVVATNRATRRGGTFGSEVAGLLFIPGYAPALTSWGSEMVDALPDDDSGKVVERLVLLVTRGASDDIGAFVDDYFGRSFLAMAPRDEHIRIMGRIQEELRGRTPVAYAIDGRRYEIALSSEDDGTVTVSTEIGPDGKIMGLGVAD